LPIIARKIVILNSQEAVPTLVNGEPVQLQVSADPVVNITADVAVVKHPDFVEKPSEYVSSMFRSYK